RCVGRVEVQHLGRWGTVCDDTWDLAAAQVTCTHLGCGSALGAPGHAHFGGGSGPIWLDGLSCSGEELTLAQCRLHTWGEHDCSHAEDAGAVCSGELRWSQVCSAEHQVCPSEAQVSAGGAQVHSGADPPQVRLRAGPGPCAGQVQVLHNRTWHQVCGLTWGLPEAQVLCRQLGCG
ncbi:DMBT1 protein, partial [Dasyornis broadbenti]|nr:DMBT1 protein [Dasyornis broadbenti]